MWPGQKKHRHIALPGAASSSLHISSTINSTASALRSNSLSRLCQWGGSHPGSERRHLSTCSFTAGGALHILRALSSRGPISHPYSDCRWASASAYGAAKPVPTILLRFWLASPVMPWRGLSDRVITLKFERHSRSVMLISEGRYRSMSVTVVTDSLEE